MKVKNLIDLLENCDLDSAVLIASDSEGNNILPLDSSAVGTGFFNPDERHISIYSPDDLDENSDIELYPCVVIYPV